MEPFYFPPVVARSSKKTQFILLRVKAKLSSQPLRFPGLLKISPLPGLLAVLNTRCMPTPGPLHWLSLLLGMFFLRHPQSCLPHLLQELVTFSGRSFPTGLWNLHLHSPRLQYLPSPSFSA